MATDFAWNDEQDMLALLDDATVLPPLATFEGAGFAGVPSLPDVFGALSAPTDAFVAAPAGDVEAFAAPPKDADILADLLRSAPAHTGSAGQAPASDSVTDSGEGAEGSVEGEVSTERDFSTPQPATSERASPSSSSQEGAANGASLSSAASDVTAGVSAVELAKKAAEDFANNKVSERKRRLKAEREGETGKRRKGNDGSSCSDGDDDAPEKVSHRKYQKRLQKNRDSAYVSRIRRREYTKRLEDSLDRVEKEKLDIQSRFDVLQRKFDLVLTELNALKDATARRFKNLAAPVGATSASNAKPKGAGAIVTTMFMFALMVGFCVPDSITSRAPWSSNAGPSPSTNQKLYQPRFNYESKLKLNSDRGRVWGALGPQPPPPHWGVGGLPDHELLKSFSCNMTKLFGAEDGRKVTQMVQAKWHSGTISEEDIRTIDTRARSLVKVDRKSETRSQRSALLRKLLRKALALADECFTKELVALLTIRLIPMQAPNKKTKSV